MTSTDDPTKQALWDAAERVAEINALYQSMRKLMQVWLESCDDPSPDMPRKSLAKLSDIQAAHLLLLKAEDRFHDLSTNGGSDDPAQDIIAIRTEIGRLLDCLRDTARESGVPVGDE